MAAASRLLIFGLLVLAMAGCSGGDPAPAAIGQVTTSKEGQAQLERNGGKPAPKAVPSVDD